MDNIENYRDALRAVQNKEIEQRKTIKKLLQDREELKKQLALYGVGSSNRIKETIKNFKEIEIILNDAMEEVENGIYDPKEEALSKVFREYTIIKN